ncbi:hypothetical protein [Methylobacterium sp. ID0610]|uniref:hypothetical protein n=1 Tax=Methylobacterium carpenticola TaxID=3344827 RepID=UPI0036D15B14
MAPATAVNHRRPQGGDWPPSIDPANHGSVCVHGHNREIQREERQAPRLDGRP